MGAEAESEQQGQSEQKEYPEIKGGGERKLEIDRQPQVLDKKGMRS